MFTRTSLISLATLATLSCGAVPAAIAASPSHKLPAAAGKLTRCHKTLYKVGSLPVSTEFAATKGGHPSSGLLTCSNANAVALAGKKYYAKYPFGVGKQVKVGGVTYTLDKSVGGSWGGLALSGPLYGWAGGGVVIALVTG